jgi:hypothetical protein
MQQAALRHTHVGARSSKLAASSDCKLNVGVLNSDNKGSYQCLPVLGFAAVVACVSFAALAL